MKTHSERMKKAAAVAAEYRKWQDHLPSGGYVVIWRMKASGWTCDLTRPSSCRPGALAVGETGQVLVATGGNYWDGAAEWSSIFDPRPMEATA